MKDTNGDLKMDTKEKVGTDHGRRDGGVEGNANTLRWGLDNYLHSAGSSVSSQLRLKDGTWGSRPTLSRGEWGVGQDDFGRIFRNSSESTLQVDLVPTPYFARNPTQIRTRGSYEVLTNDVNNINEVWPVRPNPGTNRSYQFGIPAAVRRHDHSGDGGVRPGGLQRRSVAGRALRQRVRRRADGQLRPAHRARRRRHDVARAQRVRQGGIPRVDGRTLPARGVLQRAPDGTLMIVDFYRGVIQDRASTTVYLKDYIQKRNLDNPMGVGMGRIWRIMHDDDPARHDTAAAVARDAGAARAGAVASRTAGGAIPPSACSSNAASTTVTTQLKALATGTALPRAKVKALWVLDGNDSIDVATLTTALADPSRDVRMNAVRIAERWLGDVNTRFMPRSSSSSTIPTGTCVSNSRRRSARWRPGRRRRLWRRSCRNTRDDPVVMDAALSGMRGTELAVLETAASGERAAIVDRRNRDHDDRRDSPALRIGRGRASDARHGGGRESAGVAARGRAAAALRSRSSRTRRCRGTRAGGRRPRLRPAR